MSRARKLVNLATANQIAASEQIGEDNGKFSY